MALVVKKDRQATETRELAREPRAKRLAGLLEHLGNGGMLDSDWNTDGDDGAQVARDPLFEPLSRDLPPRIGVSWKQVVNLSLPVDAHKLAVVGALKLTDNVEAGSDVRCDAGKVSGAAPAPLDRENCEAISCPSGKRHV
jgi:hypothetical protein